MEIITRKTGKLFEASAKSGAAVAGADAELLEEVGQFSLEVGRAFQIVDDTLDVIGDPGKTGKAVGTDLIEGKPTLPIIYAMEDRVHGEEIRGIFENPFPSEADVVRALGLIQKTDAVGRCLAKARSIAEGALAHLDALPESRYRAALAEVAMYSTVRQKRR